jgi:organic radical activating enzyme
LTHSFDRADNETPRTLAKWILEQARVETGVEGVTFSGGEPMQQATDLARTIAEVKEQSPQLSFGIFTGYNLAELESGRFRYREVSTAAEASSAAVWIDDPAMASRRWAKIRAFLDFAVAGRFQESKLDRITPMRSSSNQQLHLFTNRYVESDFPSQAVEIRIQPGGRTTITGFPIGLKL